MKNYYFTFGQFHHTVDGTPMKDYWVRVQATSFFRARLLFIEHFTSQEMPKRDKFAFQYVESNFNKEMFPKGEYAFFDEQELTADEQV